MLGTGTPNPQPHRSGPANLVRAAGHAALVDCGPGTARQLAGLGVGLGDISTILISHHHIDHNAELAFLLLSPWINRQRSHAAVVVGPPGTREYVDRCLHAHEYDLTVRKPHGFDPEAVVPDVLEVDDGTAIDRDGFRVRAFRVDHSPVDEAFGFRFDTPAGSIVFSGDTRPCDNLVEHATGSDVLVHEALMPGWGIPEYHTPVDDVGDIAARAGVSRLVLTHLIPGTLDDARWRERITGFVGRVDIGTDLMRVM